MKRYWRMFLMVLALALLPVSAFADPVAAGLPKESVQQLVFARNGIEALRDNVAAGVITAAQAEQGTKRYLDQASRIVGHAVTADDLKDLPAAGESVSPAKLTALQRFAGLITFVNVIWTLAIAVGVLCFCVLFGSYVKDLIKWLTNVPLRFYEVVFYLLGLGTVVGAWFLGESARPYVALTGCLVYAGATAFSMANASENGKRRYANSTYALRLLLLWAPVAVVFHSSLVGFAAVAALLAALGFSVLVTPLCYCLGFDNDAGLGRATSAAFGMLLLFAVLKVVGAHVPALQVFESGALFLGSFVGYLGLLIASSRWYDGKRANYGLFQVITILAGVAALFFGSIFGIGELQKIGGTFFVLYLMEKPFEIPAGSVRGYAAIGLLVSAAFYAFCWYVKANPDVFRPFLFMT